MNLRRPRLQDSKRRVLVITTTALIVCACMTPYKRLQSGGGYSDFRIANDVFSISFRGNTATKEEHVEKYLLRRGSELTLEHGYKYFVVIMEKGRSRRGSFGYSGMKMPVIAASAGIHIKCFHEHPPDAEVVVDAADFLRFNFPEEYDDLPAPADTDEP